MMVERVVGPQPKQKAKQGPMAKMEPDLFPAPILHRRASQSSPLSGIPLYSLYISPPSSSSYPMPGPVRSSPIDNRIVQPPRPPNAWILYRSDKLRELPPTGPGIPRRAQAEVSKLISNMWKNETEATRTEYERRADAKKAEHQAMYPGYRFQPMKKEEKERMREEKRLEKERDRAQSKRSRARPAPYATGLVAPPMPYPVQYYQPDVRYGPAGPSPPLSAASSPNDSPYHESQHGVDNPSNTLSTNASPSPSSIAPASTNDVPPSLNALSSFSAQLPPSQFAPLPPVALPPPGPSQWQQPPQQQPLIGNSPAATPAPIWPTYNTDSSQLTLDSSISQDYVNFNLPATPNLQGWMSGESNSESFSDSMQAMLSATGDPSIFQLSNFNIDELLSNPQGEIEVSMGQLPFSFDQHFPHGPEMFADYNFSSAAAGPSSQSTEDTNANLSQTLSPTDTATDLSMFFPEQSTQNISSSMPQQPDFNSFNTDNVFEYLNLEGPVSADVQPTRPGPSNHMTHLDQNTMEPTHMVSSTPYVPPAGAAYSSTRRVGASWKPTFAIPPDSPVDHSPPRELRGVSAS